MRGKFGRICKGKKGRLSNRKSNTYRDKNITF